MGDDRVASLEHDGLRDESVDHHVVGLGSEGGRVVLASHGDDQRDRLVAHGLDHATKQVEIAVPDRSHRHIDDRHPAETIEPLRRLVRRTFCGGRTKRLHRGEVLDLGVLQRRRARVHVQVAEQSCQRVRFEAAGRPMRRRRLACRAQQCERDQRAVAHVDVGNPPRRRHQWSGQLGDFVDEHVWRPCVDDALELLGSRHQLEVGEDLGQEEPALLVADEPFEPGVARCPLGPEVLAPPGAEGLEPGGACSVDEGITGGERHRVSRCLGRGGQR